MNNSRSTSAVVLIAVFTSVITSVVMVFLLSRLNLFSFGQEVTVPGLQGLAEQDARVNLESQGLVMIIDSRKSVPGTEPGTVLAQSPAAGSSTTKNSVVRVTLAQDLPSVPNVKGLTVAEATLLIEQAGFKMRVAEPVDHLSIPAGKIVSQVPTTGTNLEIGRTVTVMPSKGTVPVPNLIGLSIKKAKEQISKAGFQLGKIRWAFNEDRYAYTILRQDPEAGQKARPKTAIDLWANSE